MPKSETNIQNKGPGGAELGSVLCRAEFQEFTPKGPQKLQNYLTLGVLNKESLKQESKEVATNTMTNISGRTASSKKE